MNEQVIADALWMFEQDTRAFRAKYARKFIGAEAFAAMTKRIPEIAAQWRMRQVSGAVATVEAATMQGIAAKAAFMQWAGHGMQAQGYRCMLFPVGAAGVLRCLKFQPEEIIFFKPLA